MDIPTLSDKNEIKLLKIVFNSPGLYTTQIAEEVDYDDYKHNKTRKILMKMSEVDDKGIKGKGVVWHKKSGVKRSDKRYWYCTDKGNTEMAKILKAAGAK